MGQNLSYLVRMSKYGHIVFCSLLSQLLSNYDNTYIHVFRRLVATSKAPQSMVLSMLRLFAKLGQKLTTYGRGCPTGTGGYPESGTPQKFGHGPCYYEIKFHKKK